MNTSFSQDMLIHSKLPAPGNQNEFKRLKLLGILSAEQHKLGVGLISPAGYGKTTLMSQLQDAWREAGHVAVWLSLDDDDNDLRHFLKSFLRTLQDSIPLWQADLENQLQGQLPDERVLLHLILDEIAKKPQNYCLFIDDLHRVQNEKVLQFLLDCLQSSHWNYVLSSRQALPRGFSKLKLWGNFYELGPQHLAFTVEEIRDYFATIRNQKIALVKAEAILAATDGWPAVIPLVSLSQSQNSPAIQERELARLTHPQLEHFLSQSTFENFSPQLKEVLLQIAPLEKFCGELASSISGIDDIAWLEELQKSSLLIPLDRQKKWYRLHFIFQKFLKTELKKSKPKEIFKIYRKASAWFARYSLNAEAMEYAFLAQDFNGLLQLLEEQAAETLYHQVDPQSLLHWLPRLPEPQIFEKKILPVAYAFALLWDGRWEECRDYLKKYHDLKDHSDLPYRVSSSPENFAWWNVLENTLKIREQLSQPLLEPINLLETLISQVQQQGAHYLVLRLKLLKTLVHAQLQQREAALKQLEDSLAFAHDQHFTRLSIGEEKILGEWLLLLFESRIPIRAPSEYLEKIAQSWGVLLPHDTQEPNAVALSARELEILKKLSRGSSNQQLAKQLFISEATLKWHLKKIYRKLGVRHRQAALVEARRLRLF